MTLISRVIFSKKNIFCAGLLGTSISCISPRLDIEPITSASLTASPTLNPDPSLDYYQGRMKDLQQLTQKDELLEVIFLDVRYFIESHIAFAQGNTTLAEKKAFAALRTNKDDLSEEFFNWWLSAAIKVNFTSPPKPDALAAYILAKTENGKHCSYLSETRLTDKEKLETWLIENRLKYLDYIPQLMPTTDIPPSKATLPSQSNLPDFLTRYCEVKKNPGDAWIAWHTSLKADQRLFLSAASLRVCENEIEGGKELKALSREFLKRKNQDLYFFTLNELINHYRAVGDRDAISDAYLEQTKLWDAGVINEENTGLEGVSLELKKINDFLWAARYRALTGDYENSKICAQKAGKFITNTYAKNKVSDSSAHGKELKELQVESQHIIAFRVSLEKQDFEGARALYELALRTPNIDNKWRMVLLWHHGLLRFVSGDYEKSIEIWQEILMSRSQEAESLRDNALFWSARAHLKMGNKISATSNTLELIEKYPFSFYTLNGVSSTELRSLIEGSSLVERLSPDFKRFDDTEKFDLAKWREDSAIGNPLVRAEILSRLGMANLGQPVVKYLARKVDRSHSAKRDQALRVYLTRLQTVAGLSADAIRLTQRISESDLEFWHKWPEQIFIMYPTPYNDIYIRHAMSTGVDWALLLGVSRQESLFQAEVFSPAGAIGLMQLMPETARGLALTRSIEFKDIKSSLLFPETNINLGSLYLQNLSAEFHDFVPAVLAAYNSGSYTTRAWLKRRYQEDPLLWVELIPFAETREYVKKVWRNMIVYENLYPHTPVSH